MKKKYQVFVSSTYRDLIEERKEIIQALLELDCIPSGMELFPAANEDQWSLIKKVIDDCDYYIVVIAGRYGSVDLEGISFTEKEYRYALEQSKPIMGFIHEAPDKIPIGQSEVEPEKAKKLDEFKALVKQKMVKTWVSPADLGSVVSRSLIQTISNHPATGWVRSDNLPSESASQEILRLRNEIDQLKKKSIESSYSAPPGASELSQGNDLMKVSYYWTATINKGYRTETSEWRNCNISWNTLFSAVGPALIDECTDSEFKNKINSAVMQAEFDKIDDWEETNSTEEKELSVSGKTYLAHGYEDSTL